MATTTAFPKLKQAAMELRSRAPEDWKKFLEALNDYSTELTTYCVNTASTSELPVSQGRAQIAAHLCRELAEATK